MSLQKFDALIDKMNLAFEYAENLGQYVDAAKILFQINEQLPKDIQLTLEEIENPDDAKSFITQHKSEIKFAIVEHRQVLASSY